MFFSHPTLNNLNHITSSSSPGDGRHHHQVFYIGPLSSEWTHINNNNIHIDHRNRHLLRHHYSSNGQHLVPILFNTPTTDNNNNNHALVINNLRFLANGGRADSLESQIIRHLYMEQIRESENNSMRTNNRPTSRKTVARLPIFVCDSTDSYQQVYDDSKKECPVCLSESEDGEQLVILPCQHNFHPGCIEPWFREHNSCPTCRFELGMSNEEQERIRLTRMIKLYGTNAIALMKICTSIHFLYSEVQKWTFSSQCDVSSRATCAKKVVSIPITSDKIEDLPKKKSKILVLLNMRETKLGKLSKKLEKLPISNINNNNENRYAWDSQKLNQLRSQCSHRIVMIQEKIDNLREIHSTSKKQCCTIC